MTTNRVSFQRQKLCPFARLVRKPTKSIKNSLKLEWTPALTVRDCQPAPQANLAVTEFTEAQIHALVQKSYQAGQNGGDVDLLEVECYNCHKKGHYANKCLKNGEGGNKPISWKKKAPGDGEVQVKTVSQDGTDMIYYWCGKYKRWTTSHNTLKHGRQGGDTAPTDAVPAPAPAGAAANMAAENGDALVSSHESDDNSDCCEEIVKVELLKL